MLDLTPEVRPGGFFGLADNSILSRMSKLRKRDRPGFLLLKGRGTAPGVACGPLRGNRGDLDAAAVKGSILVAERATPDDVGRILASAGTLTLGGAVLSHVSLLSREFGKPSVSLGMRGQARILKESEAGLLELADVVGEQSPPVLREGDVVLLDGDEGTVQIPGGADPEARAQVRRVHEHLCAFGERAHDDELRALLHEVEEVESAAFAYLLEAAFLHRLVPAGIAARELLGGLMAHASLRGRLEDNLQDLKDRALRRAQDHLARGEQEARSADVLDELDRTVRRMESLAERDRLLLEDLGGDPEDVVSQLSSILEEARARRETLREELGAKVAAALRLSDETLRQQLGGLFQLLRRARAARLEEDAIAPLRRRLTGHVAKERARAGHHLIIPLDSPGSQERALVGGKAQGLLEVAPILPEGCRIPRGFVVTSAAYRLHLLGETGERLRQAVEEGGDEVAVSRKARAAILSSEIPEEIVKTVETAFSELQAELVAVRSSATIEDAPTGSLAGQFDTVLGVRDLSEALHRIRQTWASLWNARAIRALAAYGLSPLQASQAVLIQEVVNTRAAGVLVTRDPARGPDTILINAAWGLGEAISQGEVAGDLYWVRCSTGDVLTSEPGKESTRIVLDPESTGTLETPLDPSQRGRPCLSREDLSRAAALARALDEATGRAQDVEFGFADDGTLVVFQVRRVVATRKE